MFRWRRLPEEKLAALKQQAEAALRSKQYKKALSLAGQGLKDAPDDWDFWRIHADALLGEPHSREVAEEASAIYSRLAQRNPTDPAIWVRLTLALQKENRLGEALAASEQAVTNCPNVAGVWRLRAQMLKQAKRADEAITAYHMAIQIQQGGVDLLQELGELYSEQAMYNDALGLLLLRQGNPEGGLKEIERALKLDDQLVRAWRHKAETLRALGRENDAIAAARQANTLEAEQQRMEPDEQPAVGVQT